jgi:galactonate dehydratase
MRITDIETFLVDASLHGWARNWLFVRVSTDGGIYGLGEASGWPVVVERAIHDLKPHLIGEDPFDIERLWQKMFLAFMGHGMTGVVGAGAMTGIEVACWDILGKALKVPVYRLLGGSCRKRIRVYAHAGNAKRALELVERGYTAIKTGLGSVKAVREIREAVGDEVDICIDMHGPPWLSPSDAIALGKRLERYDLLFYEDPVPPENLEALSEVASKVNIPIAAGERWATIYGFKDLIEGEIVDVIQPDMARVGGLMQAKKICGMAEAHFISVAPHDGSNGPIAEAAAVHLMATIPNFLILEHIADDVPWRKEVVTPLEVKDGYIEVPEKPGLGVELNVEECLRHPPKKPVPEAEPGREYLYWSPRYGRAKELRV